MVLPRALTLPAETLARLVALENLGELHVALRPMPVWRLREAERAAEAAALAEFAALDLLDDRGRVDVELAASLAVLCRAATEFYGWIHGTGQTLGVLAAAIGREAMLAVRADDEVSLSQVKAAALPEALVGRTAEVPPGRGDTVSFLESEALASAGGRRTSAAGVGTRLASPQVRLAQRIAGQPTTGGGQLSVAVRDSLGRRRSCPHPLRYADTPSGRWLNLTTALPDQSDNRILLAPASRGDLTARLRNMHRALTR